MLALNESPDDALGPPIEHTKPDLARALHWGRRLRSGEFDWKTFQLLREFRGHFRFMRDDHEAGQLIRAARDALSGFLDASLDRESSRWSETLLALMADFDRAYTSAKNELGVLDFDDLLIKGKQLGYAPDENEQAKPIDLSQPFADVTCRVELAFLPEFFDAQERHLTQAEFIAQRITQLASEGIQAEDIGILVRSTFAARHYERKLAEYGIDSWFAGSRPLSEAPGIPEILPLLEAGGDLNQLLDRSLTMPDGLQRFASIRRVMELAESPDFLTQLQETEVTQSEGKGVCIMPLHSACPMPTVFITDIGRSVDLKPRLFAFHPDHGLSTWVVNRLSGKFAIPLAHKEIGEVIRENGVLREREVFGKALTHARDRLILVGCSNLKGDQGLPYKRIYSWGGWIEKALDLGPGTPDGEIGPRITLRTDPPPMMRTSRNTLVNQFVAEFREGRPIPNVPPSIIAEEAVARCLVSRPPITPVITRISVSQALDYLECPLRYHRLHVIGIPEEGGEPPDDLEETEVSAADLGHRVHDLLSRLDFSQDIRPQVEGNPMLAQFAESRWCSELQTADKILKEVPFEVLVAGKVLAGRMDVLYHGSSGWVVLDYKTGRAESRERYELQVGIYAQVTHQLIGEMPSQAALVLLTIGEDWVQDTSDGSVAEIASAKLTEVCASIDAGHFDPTPCKACAWCTFKEVCS